MHGPPAPRCSPPNKLSDAEFDGLLDLLRSPEFVDLAPAQVWAILLDSGRYVASISTMYRALRTEGEVRERRRQATHPARMRPELVAREPNQVWSWDISKLRGPTKGVYYDLYVIIDVRHEAPLHRVGWKDPPVACRSRPPKLRAARTWERRQGREQPRQRRDEPALPDGAGPTSKTGRCTRETSARTPSIDVPARTWWMWAGQQCAPRQRPGELRVALSRDRLGGHEESLRRTRGEAAGE